MVDHFELFVFKSVAKHLNFSKASAEVGVSAPQVTKIIATLEDKVKTKLLQRTTRSVRLTDDGQAFLKSVIKTLDALNETNQFFAPALDSKSITGVV